MNNKNLSKTIKSTFIILTIAMLSVVLIACRADSELPKPNGKKVSLTTTQLEDKLSQLTIALKDEDILYSEASHVYLSGNLDNPRTSTSHSETTYNNRNMDTWLTSTNKVTFEDSIYELTLNGFQSNTATYIDLTDTLNQPFSEDYSYMSDHIDGKYKLFRSYDVWMPNSTSLTDVYMSLGTDILITNEFLFDGNILEFIKNLHRLNFSGLAFYEHDRHFSITLDFNIVNYDEYSVAVIEYIKEYHALNPSHQQYLDFKLVMNFEENSLIEMGHIRKSGYQIDDSYFAKLDIKLYQNIVDRLPNEIIYADYELIESMEDIKI